MLPAWRALAQIEQTTQRWDDLVRSLQSIVILDPSDVGARIKLVKLFALGGRVYQALELINESNKADVPNAELLGLRAALLYKLNDKINAVRQAREALAIDPNNADALVVIATERMTSGDLKGALQSLEDGAPIGSKDLGIQLVKLKILGQLGESEQVEFLLRQLIELNPKENAFRKQLIEFYVDQNRKDDAERETRALVRENPADPEIELNWSVIYTQKKGRSWLGKN